MSKKFIILFFLVFLAAVAAAQETASPPVPAAPTDLMVIDKPDDAGHGLIVKWDLSSDDTAGLHNVAFYEIYRADSLEGEYRLKGVAPAGETRYEDVSPQKEVGGEPNPDFMSANKTYYYKVVAKTETGEASVEAGPAMGKTRAQWLHLSKLRILFAVAIFSLFLVIFIDAAKKGKKLYVRSIAGINAVDDAIGRATEMGRPILFVLGMGTAADIATIAGFTILARVAKRTAEYQTRVLVPVQDPVVLAVAQETVKNAYLEAGRPDAYDPDNVFYVTALQFPYVAAVNGIMLREKTATNFYMGVFYAESLILAETGNIAGSIQISGTDQIAQLPFFVAATDYTLIGEELYAASAYLSQEPLQLGTLKAQDYTKVIIIALLAAGIIGVTLGWPLLKEILIINNL